MSVPASPATNRWNISPLILAPSHDTVPDASERGPSRGFSLTSPWYTVAPPMAAPCIHAATAMGQPAFGCSLLRFKPIKLYHGFKAAESYFYRAEVGYFVYFDLRIVFALQLEDSSHFVRGYRVDSAAEGDKLDELNIGVFCRE